MNLPDKLAHARQKLPLKTLMERAGRGPADNNWKSFPCPYCESKGTAGVFAGPQGDLFKCNQSGCRSGTADDGRAWDEIGFLAFEQGCDRSTATRQWLEETGLWEELPNAPLQPGPQSAPGEIQNQIAPLDVDEWDGDRVVRSVLRAFYAKLALSAADREQLKTKRGLSDEIIDASGFCTNSKDNLRHLQALAQNHDVSDLIRSGLWSKERRPSGQFYGYGVVGKKKRLSPELLESGEYSALADDDFAWAWKESDLCNPILLPYYDLKGELLALRPHKGFPRGQHPRLYLAGGRKALKQCRRAVIVEGEFKAAALQSVLGTAWAVASVPGITQVKNLDVWSEMTTWLVAIRAKEVVIAFDNEEQGDASLASYKPSLEDRFEADVWARVCAKRLEKEGFKARVARLPDEWRNAEGKADWDSALAKLLQAGKSSEEAGKLFGQILHEALSPDELEKGGPLSKEAEQSIANRVLLRTYEPALPWGDTAERRTAKFLRRLAEQAAPGDKGQIIALAQAYERVLGCYYELKLSEQRHDKLQAKLSTAEGCEQIKFLKLALKGTPSVVASCRLIPLYVIIKPDGTRERLVRLINDRGEDSGPVVLDCHSYTAPRDFRHFLARVGNFNWRGGERTLQALQRDTDFKLAYRNVHQVICYGCEDPSKLWFLDDCAYAADGSVVLPDRNGIFWYQGKGFKLLRGANNVPQGEEGHSFRMKSTPRMHPEQGLRFDSAGGLALKRGEEDDPEAVRDLLGNLAVSLNDSYGGHDGAMLVAATLAFFAAPELFAQTGQFPGLWITGEKGGGKTFTAKWLMALHGLSDLEGGISFKSSTTPGMQIPMGQYANIPLWGDEYKETELRDTNIKGVIHSGFNRDVSSKWSSDGSTRSIRTNLIVTGETTCGNAATMSRFVSVTAAREKRAGTEEDCRRRLEWLQQHRTLFFIIGRTVLRQRAKFARRLMEILAEWELLAKLGGVDSRGRYTHGVSYAALVAMNEISTIYDAKKCEDFREWMTLKTLESDQEIAAKMDVNQFWRDLLSGFKAGIFGTTRAELQNFFKVIPNHRGNPPLSERQVKDSASEPHLAWSSWFLYFTPGSVIDALRTYKRSQGQVLPLDREDLRTQLKVRPYFIHGPRQGHQKKFGEGSRNNQPCWGFDLDKFEEMGRRSVSDEEWARSFHVDGDLSAGRLPAQDWIDPRKGELYLLVHALEDKGV